MAYFQNRMVSDFEKSIRIICLFRNTDNMKTVVERREAGNVIWNPKFDDIAAQMGFVPKVCKVCHPETKGKIERLAWYIKDNFFPRRQFEDLEDLANVTKFTILAGKVSLSPIIDCYEGIPVAWSISSKTDEQLVNTMLDRATHSLPQDANPIIYSD